MVDFSRYQPPHLLPGIDWGKEFEERYGYRSELFEKTMKEREEAEHAR
jgi:hypothetical protein